MPSLGMVSGPTPGLQQQTCCKAGRTVPSSACVLDRESHIPTPAGQELFRVCVDISETDISIRVWEGRAAVGTMKIDG